MNGMGQNTLFGWFHRPGTFLAHGADHLRSDYCRPTTRSRRAKDLQNRLEVCSPCSEKVTRPSELASSCISRIPRQTGIGSPAFYASMEQITVRRFEMQHVPWRTKNSLTLHILDPTTDNIAMKLFLLLAVLHVAIIRAESRVAPVYYQPITTPDTPPKLLAEIEYDPLDQSSSVVNFEFPEDLEGSKYVRIGIYDAATHRFQRSTVASSDNFSKGYSVRTRVTTRNEAWRARTDLGLGQPHFTISITEDGKYLGASLKGVRIDAGQTRDFGPQSAVVTMAPGKQVELNKPVVLSPEGKKVVLEEKSFLQKYWWVLAIGLIMLLSGGGAEK